MRTIRNFSRSVEKSLVNNDSYPLESVLRDALKQYDVPDDIIAKLTESILESAEDVLQEGSRKLVGIVYGILGEMRRELASQFEKSQNEIEELVESKKRNKVNTTLEILDELADKISDIVDIADNVDSAINEAVESRPQKIWE